MHALDNVDNSLSLLGVSSNVANNSFSMTRCHIVLICRSTKYSFFPVQPTTLRN